jgi:hypothetical protein
MKKVFLSLAVISAFSLASCKKDHTCTCINTNSANATSSTDITTYPKSSKGAARANCLTTTEVDNGITYTSTCTLK